MKEYEKTKSTLSESDRAHREEDLEFRRIKIKKQMLGNIKVIICLICLTQPLNATPPDFYFVPTLVYWRALQA